jgi:ABC-type multidrug transport system fused ATPase/permease subunit
MFIARLWNVLQDDRRLMVWSVVFGLVFTGLGIIPPLLIRQMILWLDVDTVASSFLWLGLALAAVYLLRGVSRYVDAG